MAGKRKEATDFFGSEEKISGWRHLAHSGYYVVYFVKCFFRHPLKREKPDLELLGIVRELLDDFGNRDSSEDIEKSKELIALHRTVENTHARRRLEKWSLRVIALYLFVVLMIVMATYCRLSFLNLPWLSIPNEIMIAILTTTTANIIGLGLIVLRGHFLANEERQEKGK